MGSRWKKIGKIIGYLYLSLMVGKVWGAQLIDLAGRQVDIPSKVERIILGEGRLFYALALLEGQQPFKRLVGWQGDFRKLDPQSYAAYQSKFPEIERIPLIGDTSADSISFEKILSLNADLVVLSLSGSHGPAKDSMLVKQLEKAGIPVVFIDFRASPLKNTIPSMQVLGQAIHRQQQAEEYIHFYQQKLLPIQHLVSTLTTEEKPRVFIELKATEIEECCATAGNGNFGDLIQLAGGRNIAQSLLPAALGTINLEKVLSSDPDIYIATGAKSPVNKTLGVKLGAQVTEQEAHSSLQELLQRKGISSLKAIQQGHAFAIWHSFYNSPYNILAIQAFASWFHADKFPTLDPQQTMQQLHQRFLSIEPVGTYWISYIPHS